MITVRPEHLGLSPGTRVLDVGCGDGRHLGMLRRMAGVDAIGVDLAASDLESANERLRTLDAVPPSQGGSVRDAGHWLTLRADVARLPFPDGSFDCVIASEVLEHVHDDQAVLQELTRVLRPGGTLAVSVPRTVPEAICWALSREYRDTPGGHVRIYRRNQLRRRVRHAGLRVTGGHSAHALHSPYWWLKCLVGPNREDMRALRLYHRLLVWDLMEQPLVTRALEAALTPLIGKSMVLYARKEAA